MRRSAMAAAIAVVALAAAGCGGSGSGGGTGSVQQAAGPVQHPTSLTGEVGKNDAFDISLSDESGKPITNLAAGSYQLTVHDDSGIHNFHLSGPGGVDDSTVVQDTTTKIFQVTFKPGIYTFVCDPHASQMHGSFKVS
jgi:hypothetical protein